MLSTTRKASPKARLASFRGWTDEIGKRDAAGFDNPIALPTHTYGVRKPQIPADVGVDLVDVEYDGVRPWRDHSRQGCFFGTREAHDKYLIAPASFTFIPCLSRRSAHNGKRKIT